MEMVDIDGVATRVWKTAHPSLAALAMRNLPEWPVIFFAATSIGAIAVPLNAWWTDQELVFGLENSESSILLCDAERWDRISPHLAELPELKHVIVARSQGALAADPMTMATCRIRICPRSTLHRTMPRQFFIPVARPGNPRALWEVIAT